jgi:hypothetical protein
MLALAVNGLIVLLLLLVLGRGSSCSASSRSCVSRTASSTG